MQDVGGQVAVVGAPVLRELLGAEDEDGLVAQLVVLDHRERGEGLSEADAVGEDASVEGLELVDETNHRVLLKLEERPPDFRVPVTRPVIG